MKTNGKETPQERATRLLRRYLANGIVLEANARGTQLSFAFRGMGKVVIEATEDGLVLHEPVDVAPPVLA